MKTSLFLLFLVFLLTSCEDNQEKGTLIFKGNAATTMQKIADKPLKVRSAESVHTMHTADIKFSVHEIWVSQGLAASGVKDDFKWHKIGSSDGLKSVSEFYFEVKDLPVGTYQSVKIIFRNRVQRTAVYKNDTLQTVIMAGSLNEASCGDDDLIINVFSQNGNFSLEDDVFKLASAGENIRGFKIKADGVTTVGWMLGVPGVQLQDCSFDWVDANSNGTYDCGIDQTRNFNCVREFPMFSFSVDDGEIVEPDFVVIQNAVTDIEGNVYYGVKIGNQIWMSRNLRTRRLNDSTFMNNIFDPATWSDYGFFRKEAAQCVYNSNADIIMKYGRLYNGWAVRSGKLCPKGWHVPTLTEWKTLISHLGSNPGGKLKAAGTADWSEPNEGATGTSNFFALPGGRRFINAAFIEFGESAWFWTSTDYNGGMLEVVRLDYNKNTVTMEDQSTRFDQVFGASCRCIKD